MANFILAGLREPATDQMRALQQDVATVCDRLTPVNLNAKAPDIVAANGLVRAVYPDSDAIRTEGLSACLGVIAAGVAWARTQTPAPEGSFAIVRADEARIELVSDVVASRTIWYYFDDEMFAAATSQRALVALVGNFEFELDVVSWILSTGSLGPRNGWDKRIHRLGADTILTVDRERWRLAEHTLPTEIRPVERRSDELRTELIECLKSTFGRLDVDTGRWTLPLSGGLDSRTLLCLLPNPDSQDCLTWGNDVAETIPGTDAYIAPRVAAAIGAPHRYLALSESSETVEVVLDRFISLSEGRVDNLSGYLDGFALWKMLHDEGVIGIIRGDTPFTAKPVNSEPGVIRALGFADWDSYQNLPGSEAIGLPRQELPDGLARRTEESLEAWRDRLMRCLRLPVTIAALNDLKSHFVEIANPFLFRTIIDFHATIPDDLRTDKQLLRSLFASGADGILPGPDIPFADYPAITSKATYLGAPAAVDYLRQSLDDAGLIGLVPDDVVALAKSRLEIRSDSDDTMRRRLVGLLGPRLKQNLRRLRQAPAAAPSMNFNLLAFRILMIGAMSRLLTADAASLQRRH